jgi:hypothetical protein
MKPQGRTISMKLPQNDMLTDNWNSFTISSLRLREKPIRKPVVQSSKVPTKMMGLAPNYPSTISANSGSLLDEKVFIDNGFFDKRNRILSAVGDSHGKETQNDKAKVDKETFGNFTEFQKAKYLEVQGRIKKAKKIIKNQTDALK